MHLKSKCLDLLVEPVSVVNRVTRLRSERSRIRREILIRSERLLSTVRRPDLLCFPHKLLVKGWRIFLRARVQIVHKFDEIPSRYPGNFEEQNQVLEPSIIIMNYCIIIINVDYNYIV